ncbi:27069_t:CDS:2, partial [Gigaspora margarita]
MYRDNGTENPGYLALDRNNNIASDIIALNLLAYERCPVCRSPRVSNIWCYKCDSELLKSFNLMRPTRSYIRMDKQYDLKEITLIDSRDVYKAKCNLGAIECFEKEQQTVIECMNLIPKKCLVFEDSPH